ncbi:pilus assembly protein CpaD [Sinorhizobium terangae]|uniref:Pilus assembly protein CpaD n=1 Tax=Sinorhizobium terangae TaxID=110322 RepID=A0A6N7LEJ5_SINTE|nr:CpaD family pilus assembly lipoprotein [Sinorhizobium terangae]MBB4189008.1 pilus assembly protein CpaD [Sinorhizobium terangae]MQX16281.1 hypothetical protein [Sinorhizobium terangae]
MQLQIKGLLVALTASVSGCASTAPIYVEPLTSIVVRRETNVLVVQNLRALERRRLRGFIESASRNRRDALHLIISGSPRLSEEVVRDIKEMGIDANNIQLFDQPGSLAVRIEAIVYKTRPPVCSSVSSAAVGDTFFDGALGCSVRHNLAASVGDPRDLLGNDVAMTSNGDRAAIPVAMYRTFETLK